MNEHAIPATFGDLSHPIVYGFFLVATVVASYWAITGSREYEDFEEENPPSVMSLLWPVLVYGTAAACFWMVSRDIGHLLSNWNDQWPLVPLDEVPSVFQALYVEAVVARALTWLAVFLSLTSVIPPLWDHALPWILRLRATIDRRRTAPCPWSS